MEEAAAAAQLDVAQFDLLPKLTANAGYSTRSNDAFGFGFTPDGTIATTPTASVERTRTTASVGFAWNVLDFGVSYYRARQLSDQKLIAAERRRRRLRAVLRRAPAASAGCGAATPSGARARARSGARRAGERVARRGRR